MEQQREIKRLGKKRNKTYNRFLKCIIPNFHDIARNGGLIPP